jgi:transcriptional regulator with XRE-family HTH domain
MNRRGVGGFRPEVLRALRERAGLSTVQLSRISGIPRQELESYESGREPGPDRIARLAAIFKVAPLDFVNQDVIGHGLRSLRMSAGLRQADMIVRAGLSPSQLTYLESGKRWRLDDGLAERLARVLGVSARAVRRAHAWDVARYEAANGVLPAKAAARKTPQARQRPATVLPGPVSGISPDGLSFDGDALRARRERAGLTVTDLRRLTGIPAAELTGYEAGRAPRPGRLVLLARAFGVGPLDLLDRKVIGYGLKALRTAAGLRQQDLVLSADVSLSLLRNLEDGTTRRISHEVVERLARALGATAEAVWEAHDWDVANFDASPR